MTASYFLDNSPPFAWKNVDATSHPVRWQLEAIIADLDSKPWERVSELPPEQAQAVMDELQRILDDSPQIKSVTRTSAIKCLQAIVSLFDGLPASMTIRDVIQDSDKPLCGGSFSDVWLGRVGSQRVALKVLRIYDNDGDEKYMRASKAFRRDALLWRQLRHPGILPVFGVNTTAFSPRPCIVSPYMCNGNVNQFLQRNPTHDRLRMIVEIMNGINFLHSHDDPIVHGDIRGANILIKDDLTCCISDVGITSVTLIDSRMPESRLTGGTTRWLAPEVIKTGGGVEDMPSGDIYAFGCTIIEICSGKVPFPNIPTDIGVCIAVVVDKLKPPPPPPTTFLPQGVWGIVDRCLAYEVRHRPNARKVLEVLKKISQEEETWMLKDTTPAIFALTVGIDKYRHNPFIHYSGCVADADDMVNVLVETLHVPLTHITNLRNENATAAGITAALESLAVDKRITKNASIIIFYAGHCMGHRTGAPPTSRASCNKSQTLVPYDFDPGSDPNPVTRNALADVKISQLLEHVADAKGNNITVILDTSHPSIGTLGTGCMDSGTNDHGMDPPGGNILRENKASHVLLTGCTKQQQAFEKDGRGAFTSTLVDLLMSEDLQQLTYSDIICRLPALPNQHPQCYGKYQHRIFLGGAAPLRIRILYRVTHWQSDAGGASKYVVNAGEAHGVTVNAEFTVYDTKACTKEIGRLVVRQSAPFRSFLRPVNDLEPFILPETIGYALLTDIRSTQDVRLLVDLDSDLVGVLASLGEQMRAEYPGKPSFQVATLDEHPHLVVTANEGRLRFEITDKMCRHAGLLEIPHTSLTDRETMTRVLRGIADFYWNLNRTPSDNRTILGTKIQLECYELEQEDPAGKFSGVMKCTGANLFVNGVIQAHTSDEEKVYGFRIENMTSIPLFVSMFYFNMSDLSIDSYYEPPSARDNGHLAPLPPGETLTIGHASDPYGPRTLFLRSGQDVDVGYLKLFISTDYVDLSMTPQSSPFLPEPFISTKYVDHDRILQSSPFPPDDDGRRHGGGYPKLKSLKLWDTMLVPIVQRREA